MVWIFTNRALMAVRVKGGFLFQSLCYLGFKFLGFLLLCFSFLAGFGPRFFERLGGVDQLLGLL